MESQNGERVSMLEFDESAVEDGWEAVLFDFRRNWFFEYLTEGIAMRDFSGRFRLSIK